MLFLFFYYIVLPMLAARLIIKLIRRYGGSAVPEDIRLLVEKTPIEKKRFRALRRQDAELTPLGDFETHPDAVDRIYLGRAEALHRGEAASFLVLNDKGEALEQVDS